MTHPTEVKPREGEQEGTLAPAFEIGAALPELRFTIDPGIVREYVEAIDGDPAVYEIDGRPAAPPNVLAVYLLAILYRRFPPAQGIILAKQRWEFRHPIWADEDTEIIGAGEVLNVEDRRGKSFVRWRATFTRSDGTPLAAAENEFYVPSPEEADPNG
ncbi:MaoC family dehydratase [Actinomadura sp. 1N219]|uniref:MaoC family dehydratase n=1 Tax=Actinomadura sp. 1N219 TaxID=3375152 RepID=UPI0037B3EAE0